MKEIRRGQINPEAGDCSLSLTCCSSAGINVVSCYRNHKKRKAQNETHEEKIANTTASCLAFEQSKDYGRSYKTVSIISDWEEILK